MDVVYSPKCNRFMTFTGLPNVIENDADDPAALHYVVNL